MDGGGPIEILGASKGVIRGKLFAVINGLERGEGVVHVGVFAVVAVADTAVDDGIGFAGIFDLMINEPLAGAKNDRVVGWITRGEEGHGANGGVVIIEPFAGDGAVGMGAGGDEFVAALDFGRRVFEVGAARIAHESGEGESGDGGLIRNGP